VNVVADTSPLNYLVLAGHIELLPVVLGPMVVPESVLVEMTASKSRAVVASWASSPPAWLSIRRTLKSISSGLGRGESDAIALALEIGSPLVLPDDRKARTIAESFGLRVTGTLGVVVAAARSGLIDPEAAIERLRQTSFHAAESVYAHALRLARAT
jgi:predicted nucleic acid-binding protein